jgi:malonyl-CoA/methylmalonyl-CoA synthetase
MLLNEEPDISGQALPGVEIRLVDESNNSITDWRAGRRYKSGPGVLKNIGGKSEATQKASLRMGGFKTGDIAKLDGGYYKILGRGFH